MVEATSIRVVLAARVVDAVALLVVVAVRRLAPREVMVPREIMVVSLPAIAGLDNSRPSLEESARLTQLIPSFSEINL